MMGCTRIFIVLRVVPEYCENENDAVYENMYSSKSGPRIGL